MACRYIGGMEIAYTAQNDWEGEDVSWDTSRARTGARCAKVAAGVTRPFGAQLQVIPTGTVIYWAWHFQVNQLPTPTDGILLVPALPNVTVTITPTGTIAVYKSLGEGGALVGESTLTVAANTWFRVELKGQRNGSGSDVVEVRVTADTPGATPETIYTASTNNFGAGPYTLNGVVGDPGGLIDVYVDDVIANDNTAGGGFTAGTDGANDSWPGDQKVAFLDPTSDVAVGSGWTSSLGGALYVPLATPHDGGGSIGSYAQGGTAGTSYDATTEAPSPGSGRVVNCAVPVAATWDLPSSGGNVISVTGLDPVAATKTYTNASLGSFTKLVVPGTILHRPSFPALPKIRVTRIGTGLTPLQLVGLGWYVSYTPGGRSGLTMLV